uniref:RUN domain-containing protein n=1 Tax=Macrostomum lignano TaxID=282301 RepID=A0A1I8I2V3_9PLAT
MKNLCDEAGSAASSAALLELESALQCCSLSTNGAYLVTYSEVRDDCSIIRRQLVSGQLVHRWQSCLRSGEVLVQLMHKSDKAFLSAHGCPLLPLQEGAENLDWCSLRSRFLGNWCNILNVMRYMQRKCPGLSLQCLGAGTGEAIVDGLDAKRSQKLMLASVAQCLALLYWEKILAQPQQSGTEEQGCRMQQQQQQQQQQPNHYTQYQHSLDFNNNAGQAATQRQQGSSQPKRRRQLQPKIDRLKDGARVTCVYDTTTEESAAAAKSVVAGVAVASGAKPQTGGSTASAAGGAHGDCSVVANSFACP